MRTTISDVREMKRKKEKIVVVTAYDYTSARIIENVGIPIILVGDTLGQVMLGYDSTIPVTMEDMIHHTKAVTRGSNKALIIGDMPFMSYQANATGAILNAGRFLQEGGAHAVKLEGGTVIAETIQKIVSTGIPVMGHIGLTPQSVNQLGGYRVQGKTVKAALQLLEDAIALENAGVFSIVLECIPSLLAKLITEHISVPTISIGSGKYCDGQVQVFHDMLGLYQDFVPKHAKRYANLAHDTENALKNYYNDVKEQNFPDDSHSYVIKESILAELKSRIGK